MWPQSVGESLYWVELRPLEDGRYVVVRRAPDGEIADVTPAGVSARTLVHEYGGGMYVAFRSEDGGESVVFSDQADQRLYRQDLRTGRRRPRGRLRAGARRPPGARRPSPTSATRAHRYADGRVTPDGRLLVSVRERHEAGGEVVNELVSLPADGSAEPRVIASGHDFYAAPRLSPDGRRLAWLSLGPPAHAVGRHRAVDGGARRRRQRHRRAARRRRPGRVDPAAALEPVRRALVRRATAPAGGTSTRSTRGRPGDAGLPEPCPLVTRAAEFAGVPWVFGLQNYAFLDDGRLLVCYTEDGRDHLAVLDAGGRRRGGRSAQRPAPSGAGPSHEPAPCASSTRRTPSSTRSRRSATAPA